MPDLNAEQKEALVRAVIFGDLRNAVKIAVNAGPGALDFIQAGLDRSPLMLAAANRDIKMICMLSKCGADANFRNDRGWSALYLALLHESQEKFVKRDFWGDTVYVDPAKVTALLISTGADPNLAPEDNHTALHEAVYYCADSSARLLLKAGANPSAVNSSSRISVLHETCYCLNKYAGTSMYYRELKILDALIAAKADLSVKDRNGFIPQAYIKYASVMSDFWRVVAAYRQFT